MSFKFELWEIEDGVVVTRPVDQGEGELKNSSVFRENPLDAIKEVELALQRVKAHYSKKP